MAHKLYGFTSTDRHFLKKGRVSVNQPPPLANLPKVQSNDSVFRSRRGAHGTSQKQQSPLKQRPHTT